MIFNHIAGTSCQYPVSRSKNPAARNSARRMRDQLAAQRHEVDLIATATATATMREIAHENDTVAQDLTVTVGVLASRADEFEREVRRPAREA